jgi:hypothetical protein
MSVYLSPATTIPPRIRLGNVPGWIVPIAILERLSQYYKDRSLDRSSSFLSELDCLLPYYHLLPLFLTSFPVHLKMSSLLEPDFSLTLSETAESSTDHSKKYSLVWKHTCRPNPNENPALLYCIHCKLDSTPLPYGTHAAENMSKHIKRHHKEVVLEKALSKNQEAVNQQIRQLYR